MFDIGQHQDDIAGSQSSVMWQDSATSGTVRAQGLANLRTAHRRADVEHVVPPVW